LSGNWQELLEQDRIVLIDGGTGTELERRGVVGDEATWSGRGMYTHDHLVREIHEDYIRAGAQVIATNTFGTTRQMLEGAGLGDEITNINRRAVEVAIEARDNVAEQPVAIAGSISAMPAHFDRSNYGDRDAELEVYRELVDILVTAGVDLIACEMMEELDHSPLAIQAAMETGLPVWLGISCRLHPESGAVVSYDHPKVGLEQLLDAFLPTSPEVVNLMHSEIDAIPEAMSIVQQTWTGPIGVYPESGYFTKPSWNFVDIISPDDLVNEARGWVAAGARILGGCCGTNPDHIRALRDALPDLEASSATAGTR
jgi:S-methylmethionine-dependent homocysteine/selenocysteine methylase